VFSFILTAVGNTHVVVVFYTPFRALYLCMYVRIYECSVRQWGHSVGVHVSGQYLVYPPDWYNHTGSRIFSVNRGSCILYFSLLSEGVVVNVNMNCPLVC
jgi:hypothetical protein